MVLCISELYKIFILLSIRNVSPWRGKSKCFSVFEVRWFLSTGADPGFQKEGWMADHIY